MDTPPERLDRLEQRIQMITRSGRRVRPPVRYEPDPDQVFEDDFSDEMSDTESAREDEDGWGYREEVQTSEHTGDDEHEESVQSDFTDTESRDSSYESTGSQSSDPSSTDDDEQYDDSDTETGLDETDDISTQTDVEEEDLVDVLEWDTLTIDASDHNYYSSEDDQDDRDL